MHKNCAWQDRDIRQITVSAYSNHITWNSFPEFRSLQPFFIISPCHAMFLSFLFSASSFLAATPRLEASPHAAWTQLRQPCGLQGGGAAGGLRGLHQLICTATQPRRALAECHKTHQLQLWRTFIPFQLSTQQLRKSLQNNFCSACLQAFSLSFHLGSKLSLSWRLDVWPPDILSHQPYFACLQSSPYAQNPNYSRSAWGPAATCPRHLDLLRWPQRRHPN